MNWLRKRWISMFRWPGVATFSTTTNLMPTFWNRSKTRTNWFLEVSQGYSRKSSLPAPSSSTMKQSYYISSLSLSLALTSTEAWDICANIKRRKLSDSKSTYLRPERNARAARTRMSSCKKRRLAARTSLRKQRASWIVLRRESSSISSSKMILVSALDQLMSSSNW